MGSLRDLHVDLSVVQAMNSAEASDKRVAPGALFANSLFVYEITFTRRDSRFSERTGYEEHKMLTVAKDVEMAMQVARELQDAVRFFSVERLRQGSVQLSDKRYFA